jgi:hypothetical protein
MKISKRRKMLRREWRALPAPSTRLRLAGSFLSEQRVVALDGLGDLRQWHWTGSKIWYGLLVASWTGSKNWQGLLVAFGLTQ